MKSEPVVTASAVTGVLIALAGIFHIVLDTSLVETLVAALLPVALSLFARAKVTPIS